MMRIRNRAVHIGVALGVALLALTGCTNDGGSKGTQQEQSAAQATEADAVTIEDAWVKSAESGEMTSGFGALVNSSDQDVTVVSVASPASPTMELHETVADGTGQMTMREVAGGFVIPAHDHLHLEPGGNHLMMMGLPDAVKAGQEVAFTLTFSDSSTLRFTAVVKDYAGANENYDGDMDDEHDHGEH